LLIECSHCRAVFSVQDGVAQPGASFPVQCGRCLASFEAVAPARAPAAAAAAPVTSPPGVPAGAVEVPLSPIPEAVTALPEAVAAAAAPMLRRMARGRWPLLVGGLVLAAIAGVAVNRRERMREIEEKIAQGQEKLLRDDTRSLQEATRLFTEAARAAPGRALPEAQRAFALLLHGSAQKDMAARVSGPQREAEARVATRLLQQGTAAAKQAIADEKDDPVALRAMAMADALAGAADEAKAHADQAARAAPGNPWALYAQAAAAISARSPERAIQALSAARQAEPRLLRADVDLAAISLDKGDRQGARELLQKVLAANPDHDRARYLLTMVAP
jgi:predicted Zn finger-like uncharacterized protein